MRLQRIGRKNDPAYRVIVTDSRRGPKSGKNVDHIGSYNPKLNNIQIDGEKANEWIGKGVQVSDTVHNLLISQGIIKGAKINVLPRKSPIVNEEAKKAEEEAKAKAEASVEEESESSEADGPAVAESVDVVETKEDATSEASAEAVETPEEEVKS